MKLRVKMFGALAEAVGAAEETLELPDEATGAHLMQAVAQRHPGAAPMLERVAVAVNLEVVPPDSPLSAGDEVALLPPVAGGAADDHAPSITTGLRERPSVTEALAAVAGPEAGGTAVFLGTVRDHSEAGPVARLDYSAYEEMAEKVLREIAEEAAEKWALAGVAIIHAVGSMAVGDLTMVVACAAPHRGEAFDAGRYVVDEVKRRVPVFKKEILDGERGPGGERWVNLE